MLWCKVYVDILNCLGVTDECDRQTDGQTDSLVAYAAFHYVAWPKINKKLNCWSYFR